MGQKFGSGRIWTPSGLQYDDPIYNLFPGDRPPLVASAYDDEFMDGSIDSKWAWRNQGGATIAEASGVQTLTVPAASGDNLRCREQTFSGGDFFLTAKIAPVFTTISNTLQGLYVGQSSNGRLITWHYQWGANVWLAASKYNSATSFNSSVGNPQINSYHPSPTYLGIKLIGTTLSFWKSSDGYTWGKGMSTTASVTTGQFLTAIDRIGFFQQADSSFGAIDTSMDVNWFRVS